MGSLGWPEILVILVVALIVFGPRKLPELGKSLGQGLAQFKKASDDFKRTWEEEVEVEKRKLDTSRDFTEAKHDTVEHQYGYGGESVAGEAGAATAEAGHQAEPHQAEPSTEGQPALHGTSNDTSHDTSNNTSHDTKPVADAKA